MLSEFKANVPNEFLIRVHRLSHQIAKILGIYYSLYAFFVVNIIVYSLSAIITTLLYGYFDGEKQIVINCYVPFCSKFTFKGWTYGVVFALFVDGAYCILNAATLTLFISAALHFHAFYLQYKAIIQNFDEVLTEQCGNNRKSKRFLIEAMEFQISIKE